eukprot:358566-Chlamydomonas_euryale.AAC.1
MAGCTSRAAAFAGLRRPLLPPPPRAGCMLAPKMPEVPETKGEKQPNRTPCLITPRVHVRGPRCWVGNALPQHPMSPCQGSALLGGERHASTPHESMSGVRVAGHSPREACGAVIRHEGHTAADMGSHSPRGTHCCRPVCGMRKQAPPRRIPANGSISKRSWKDDS